MIQDHQDEISFFVPPKKSMVVFNPLLCPLSRTKARSHGFACFNMKDLHSSTLNHTSPSWTRKPFSFSQLGKLEIYSFENCRFQDLLLWVETAQLGITNCNPSKILYNFEKEERSLSWNKTSFSTHHNLHHYFCLFSWLRMVVGCRDSIYRFTRLPLELQQNMPRWQGRICFLL